MCTTAWQGFRLDRRRPRHLLVVTLPVIALWPSVDEDLFLPGAVETVNYPSHGEGEGKGAKRLRLSATGCETPSVQQIMAAQNTLPSEEIDDVLRCFQQRTIEMATEQTEREQREINGVLVLSG